jgi:oligoribonuclease
VTSATETHDPIVWVDCEMTGLDLKKDALVEIAVVVTDSELTLIDEGIDLLIAPPPEALEQMSDVVREMHTTSGLLTELRDGLTLEDASMQVLEYVRARVPDQRRAPLAGNSVGTDRAFLERDIQALTDYLHYRIIDVSSIKELARRWYPRVYFNAPAKSGGHRAMADILESITELRYYRAALFPAEPGPDTATARKIASNVNAQGRANGLRIASQDGVAVHPSTAPQDVSHQG